MKVLRFSIVVMLLLFIGSAVNAQVAFSVNGLYSLPSNDLQDEGYRDGVGLNADLMFSPIGPRSPIQLQVGPDFKMATAGSEGTKIRVSDFESEEWKYKLRNRHISMELKARALVGPRKLKAYGEVYTGWRNFYTNEKLQPVSDGNDTPIVNKVTSDDGVYVGYGLGMIYQLAPKVYFNTGVDFASGRNIKFTDLDSFEEAGDEISYGFKDAIGSDVTFVKMGFYFHL